LAVVGRKTDASRPPGSGCVLVVEDDPLIRRAVVRYLSRSGYSTLEAPDGATALEHIRESPDRLVAMILDLMLPILDGFEVARWVQARHPDLPIVACSAILDEEVRATLRSLGVQAFLPKPFTSEALLSTLSRAVNGT